jgi:hypothetical protein
LVVGDYALSTIVKIILAFSITWQQVFFLKALKWSGKGVRSAPRDAMISESTEMKAMDRDFGLHRAMDSSEITLGSALAYIPLERGL